MKRNVLGAKARELYVQESMEFKEIAEALKINERTVRTWAKREDWANHRAAWLESKMSLKADVQRLARGLLRYMVEAVEAGDDISTTKTSVFRMVYSSIFPREDFRREDEEAEAEEQEPKQSISASSAEIGKIMAKLLGVSDGS